MACPDENELVALSAGTLPVARRLALLEHLGGCDGCREIAAQLVRERSGSGGGTPAPALVALPLAEGARVGRYVVQAPLGAGAFGVVYEARDPELNRAVALKLLHPERTGAASQARLLREARLMAQLAHPNVVTVFDVGLHEGALFVALERVEGGTLRAWLAEHRPSWRRCVDLFLDVGKGLEAAHALGVVHRDFKPENVLVGPDGRPRVTDFGLAREEGEPREPEPAGPTASPQLSASGQLAGTPAYMAPEQLAGERATPAADQFAFCVALYEALYGQAPFEGKELATLAQNVRAGRLRPPPAGRAPAGLGRLLQRGLATEPAARFPSLSALLAQLARYSSRRRTTRTALAAAAGCALALVGTAAAGRVAAQRECAAAARRVDAFWSPAAKEGMKAAFLSTSARGAAEAYGVVAQALDGYVADWSARRERTCLQAHGARGDDALLAQGLVRGCLDGRYEELAALVALLSSADAPLVQRAPTAVAGLAPLEACDHRSPRSAPLPPPTAPAAREQVERAKALLAQSQALHLAARYDAALAKGEEARGLAKAAGYAPLEAEALLIRGNALYAKGEFVKAAAGMMEAVRAAEAGRHDELAARAWIGAVTDFDAAGNTERSDEAALFAQAALERLGGDAFLSGSLWAAMGNAAYSHGRNEEGQRHYEAALAQRSQVLPADHVDLAKLRSNLALIRRARGQYDEATAEFLAAAKVLERSLGESHPLVMRCLTNAGQSLNEAGKYAEARPLLERALALRISLLGPDHPELIASHAYLGIALKGEGRLQEAISQQRRGVEIAQTKLPPDHPDLGSALAALGASLMLAGQLDEALSAHQRALVLQTKDAPGSQYEASAHAAVADVLLLQHQLARAEPEYRTAIAQYEKAVGAQSGRLASPLHGLGELLLEAKRPREAVPVLERACALAAGEGPLEHGQNCFALARALWESGGDRARALKLAQNARAELKDQPGAQKQELAKLERWLAAR